MARLEPLMVKVIEAHGANHPELQGMGGLFQQLCADLKPHMFKEEQILFPYIVEMETSALQNRPAPFAPFGTVKNPVRMMMMEHSKRENGVASPSAFTPCIPFTKSAS
jgi:regulator of cell morphogenesis and NO signaling